MNSTRIEGMKRVTPIHALRLLTGMFNPDHAISILAFVNLLARYLDNDDLLEEKFLIEQFRKIKIDLILNDETKFKQQSAYKEDL